MKVVLCGYHWTGCKALELLLEQNFQVFVYTHKTEYCAADLEGMCLKNGIAYTLDKITIENLPFEPDVICSIYYRYIISEEVIQLVHGKIFNLHPALLPKYRGCSSLTWAMINGESQCGFTYHYINKECDTGNILIQVPLVIEQFDTQLTLYNRVMFEAMKYFNEALEMVIVGNLGIPQLGVPTIYKRGCPFNGKLTDDMDDDLKERFIRAMVYPPYPVAEYNGQEISTWSYFRHIKMVNENE